VVGSLEEELRLIDTHAGMFLPESFNLKNFCHAYKLFPQSYPLNLALGCRHILTENTFYSLLHFVGAGILCIQTGAQ
jgi:hypothetical protein